MVNARAHYQRTLSLRQQGFVSQAAVDKARAELDAAHAARGQTAVASDMRRCTGADLRRSSPRA
jgi:multidrug resistance efflux pump